jgi:hypothetical protein
MEVDYLVRQAGGAGADRWSLVRQCQGFAPRLEWNGGRVGQKLGAALPHKKRSGQS